MLSKNKIKFINSLSLKKHRDESGLFIAEGEKIVSELSSNGFSFELLVTSEKFSDFGDSLKCERIITSDEEIKKISSRDTPTGIVAICKKKKYNFNYNSINDKLFLALDGIQDPGNLGTIIRLASWFGIEDVVCSLNTVDCFNQKVVQSTMGAIATVNIEYTDLSVFFNKIKDSNPPVYGTFLNGENIYNAELKETGVIILGNEGNGISYETEKFVSNKLFIPPYKAGKSVESLNVSMAAAIVLSEFRRRVY